MGAGIADFLPSKVEGAYMVIPVCVNAKELRAKIMRNDRISGIGLDHCREREKLQESSSCNN